MAKIRYLFPFIHFLLLSTTFAFKHKATSFIRTDCTTTTTRYLALCIHSLSTYSNQIGHSNRQLAAVALALSHAKAKSAAASLSRLERAGKGSKLGHQDLAALSDCADTVSDGARELRRSVMELTRKARPGEEFAWRMSNVETWVSTALTDMQTCLEGFVARSPVKAVVRRRLSGVTQLTSVALAFVNRFAAGHG